MLRVQQPQPVEKIACTCCSAMMAEVFVPDPELPFAACWLCAHMVTVHGADPADSSACMSRCECAGEALYPPDVLARRRGEVRGLGYPSDTISDGETVSGEWEDRSQKPRTFSLYTRNERDESVLVETFERVDDTHVRRISIDVRPFTRSEKIAMTWHRKGAAASQAKRALAE